jgi:hypothetical protein
VSDARTPADQAQRLLPVTTGRRSSYDSAGCLHRRLSAPSAGPTTSKSSPMFPPSCSAAAESVGRRSRLRRRLRRTPDEGSVSACVVARESRHLHKRIHWVVFKCPIRIYSSDMPRSSRAVLTARLARIKELAAAIPVLSGEKTATANRLADQIKREVDAIASTLKRTKL